MRSLARELPRARCKQVNTEGRDLDGALARLVAEFAVSGPAAAVEVSYFAGRRHVPAFVELSEVVAGEPLLGRDSLVVATGGARGVTAVVAGGRLRRFGCELML